MEILSTNEKGLQRAIEILKSDGIGAFPTDTVYGLGTRIDAEPALRKIFKAKGRSYRQPLPVLIANIDQLNKITLNIPPAARILAKYFWPGGLTIILPKTPQISKLISAGGDSVGVRLPNHPIPLALIRGLGIPVIGTSANLSGQPSLVTAKEVIAQLKDKIDFIIDGGYCPGSSESTVIDFTRNPLQILREGAISRAEIERVLQTIPKEGIPNADCDRHYKG